jgi:ribosomal protein S18 acetylase RimI-like enzyme
MIIREVRPSDFDDIVATFYSYFDEVKADPGFGLLLQREKPTMDDERKWFDALLKEINEGNAITIVAEVRSHVIGNCMVRRTRPATPADHRATLGIAVKNGYRGRGIGEAMMKAAIEKCKGTFEVVELTVLSHNQAKKLYESLGFRTFGTRPYALKRGGRYFAEDLMYLKL